jgi:hypothetical protein
LIDKGDLFYEFVATIGHSLVEHFSTGIPDEPTNASVIQVAGGTGIAHTDEDLVDRLF